MKAVRTRPKMLLEAAGSCRFLRGIADVGWPDSPDFSVGNF
jgi:hypothetical protein